jgi:hypothetical protein
MPDAFSRSADRPAAEADLADPDACSAEIAMLHRFDFTDQITTKTQRSQSSFVSFVSSW